MTGTVTERLWDAAAGIYEQVLGHPFLAGLTDGTLPSEAFGYYIAQDAHYLRDYARTLAVVAAKAPSHADTALLARHAAETAEVELALHETLLPQLGIDPAALAAVPVSPTTTAYTSYLLATAYGGSFADGLAAVLPCYWIYQRVGATLVGRGSPEPRYQAWIDTYAGDEFAGSVRAVLDLADGLRPDHDAEVAMRGHFVTTARYEWMFWDAAWRREVAGMSLDSVTLAASDLSASVAFYEAALTALGFVRTHELVDEEEDDAVVEAVGWGPPERPAQVWVVTGSSPTLEVHLRLRATSRLDVEEFHAAALQAGGVEHASPRRWTPYRRGEFSAIVRDPDGNLVEAVAPE